MPDLNLKEFENFMIEEELAENTILVYLHSVKMYFQKYNEITKANVLKWKTELQEQFKPQTVNLRLSGIRKYCEFKEINLKIKEIKLTKKTSVENVITEEQYDKLIQGLINDENTRWVVIVKVLAKTGARISEALRFTKADLLNGSVTMHTKGKMRTIYFPKSLVSEIMPYIKDLKDNEPILKNHNDETITSRGVSGELKKYAVKYGIPRENVHPHAFRHFFAIQFLKRNNNISLLADLLGHSGVNTTMIYLRMSQQQQKTALDEAVNW